MAVDGDLSEIHHMCGGIDTADGHRHGIAVPFLLGTAIGGVAGAIVGMLLSRHMSHALAAMIGVVDRRLTTSDRDELRFEFLLQ